MAEEMDGARWAGCSVRDCGEGVRFMFLVQGDRVVAHRASVGGLLGAAGEVADGAVRWACGDGDVMVADARVRVDEVMERGNVGLAGRFIIEA